MGNFFSDMFFQTQETEDNEYRVARNKFIGWGIVLMCLIVAIIYGIYRWQTKDNESTNKKLDTSMKKVELEPLKKDIPSKKILLENLRKDIAVCKNDITTCLKSKKYDNIMSRIELLTKNEKATGTNSEEKIEIAKATLDLLEKLETRR